MSTNETSLPPDELAAQVLQKAGWGIPPSPDHSRIEVIAYRASLEATQQQAPGEREHLGTTHLRVERDDHLRDTNSARA